MACVVVKYYWPIPLPLVLGGAGLGAAAWPHHDPSLRAGDEFTERFPAFSGAKSMGE